MTSSGPLSPATTIDDATVGTIPWVNLNNSKVSDNVYATISCLVNEVSHYIKATNFSFAIPTGSIINGIVVEVERKRGTESQAVDNSVRIVKENTVQGDEKASGTAWGAVDAYTSYGSSVDLWGLVWTAEDINASTFGVAFSGTATSVGAGNEMSVDHIRITVYYTQLFFYTLITDVGLFSVSASPVTFTKSLHLITSVTSFNITSGNTLLSFFDNYIFRRWKIPDFIKQKFVQGTGDKQYTRENEGKGKNKWKR